MRWQRGHEEADVSGLPRTRSRVDATHRCSDNTKHAGRWGGRVDGEAGSTGRPVAWPGSGRSSLTTLVGRSALTKGNLLGMRFHSWEKNGIGIPHWELPGRLSDVSQGTERFHENNPGHGLPAGTSGTESLDTAGPQIKEQLEQSFRNLAPELQGLEAYDNPSRGGRNSGACVSNFAATIPVPATPLLRAAPRAGARVTSGQRHTGEERREALPESQRHEDMRQMAFFLKLLAIWGQPCRATRASRKK
jgi:hypothetical protein